MPTDESSGKGISKRATSGGRGSCPKDPATQQKEASGLFAELEKVLGRMAPYRVSYTDIEGTHRELERARQLLGEKDRGIEALRKEKDAVIERQSDNIAYLEKRNGDNLGTYKTEYSAFKKAKEEAERNKSAVQEEAKRSLVVEVNKWKKLLEEKRVKTASVQQRLGRLEREKRNVDKKLQDWENNLKVLEEVNLKGIATGITDLHGRWIDIVRTYFLVALPESFMTSLKDYDRWERIPSILGVELPLTPNNSPEARKVRMITALHILSSLLCDIILTPSYIPESEFASRAMKEILDDQYHVDEKREKMVRGLILTVYGEEEVGQAGRRAVDSMIDKAKECLGDLTPDIEGFIGELRVLLEELVKIWKKAQKSQRMILASVESMEGEDGEWDHLEEFGTPSVSLERTNTKLFPRIFVPDDIIHSGTVVWSTQQALIGAQMEYEEFIEAQTRKRKEVEKLKQNSFKTKFSSMFPGKPRRQLSISSGQGTKSVPASPDVNGGSFPALGDAGVQGSPTSSVNH
ncbi:MAG: hypothetical protein M1840_005147 [Geoglossum simile]|nr:MAG: hypothetical protein M1840_005147 [Geoglossum simile]